MVLDENCNSFGGKSNSLHSIQEGTLKDKTGIKFKNCQNTEKHHCNLLKKIHRTAKEKKKKSFGNLLDDNSIAQKHEFTITPKIELLKKDLGKSKEKSKKSKSIKQFQGLARGFLYGLFTIKKLSKEEIHKTKYKSKPLKLAHKKEDSKMEFDSFKEKKKGKEKLRNEAESFLNEIVNEEELDLKQNVGGLNPQYKSTKERKTSTLSQTVTKNTKNNMNNTNHPFKVKNSMNTTYHINYKNNTHNDSLCTWNTQNESHQNILINRGKTQQISRFNKSTGLPYDPYSYAKDLSPHSLITNSSSSSNKNNKNKVNVKINPLNLNKLNSNQNQPASLNNSLSSKIRNSSLNNQQVSQHYLEKILSENIPCPQEQELAFHSFHIPSQKTTRFKSLGPFQLSGILSNIQIF